MRLFVYYAVPRGHEGAVVERLRTLARDLGALAPRMMRRPGTDGDTWLEFYDGVDDDFEATLAACVAAAGLAAWTGPRHVERFDDYAIGP